MELLAGIIEGVVSLIVGLIELIVGVFVEGAAGLGGLELLGLLIVLILELIWWAVLVIVELVVSAFKLKKPKAIKRPIIWRPKKLMENAKNSENT
ncbi:MAG: hypothetical protein OIF51_19165 [Cellvibrionaceae bacterium]|nr:hypothetical protein [Cellvibrionaceae bacterium]